MMAGFSASIRKFSTSLKKLPQNCCFFRRGVIGQSEQKKWSLDIFVIQCKLCKLKKIEDK